MLYAIAKFTGTVTMQNQLSKVGPMLQSITMSQKGFLAVLQIDAVQNENHFLKNVLGGAESQTVEFCYECHEELIHNPVILPKDILAFSQLVSANGLSETVKSSSRSLLAQRIILFQQIIHEGIAALSKKIEPSN